MNHSLTTLSRRVLPYIGGLVLIIILVRQIDPADVWGLIRDAEPGWLLIGCGWYLLTNLLRAFRFGVLLRFQNQQRSLSILPEMFALSFLNNVLPSRTGELSFPYFMQRRHQIAVGESATALILARFFDYLAVMSLFVVFAVFELGNLGNMTGHVVGVVILLAALSVGLLLLAPWLSTALLQAVRWGLRLGGAGSSNWGKTLLQIAADIVEALATLRSFRIYARVYGWSIVIWLCTFAWFDAFLQAIGFAVDYTLVIVGATFASLAKALPFITVGGFGAHEAGWTLGFRLTGMNSSAAIISGFAVNILTLAMSVVFGGLALILIGKKRRPPLDYQKGANLGETSGR